MLPSTFQPKSASDFIGPARAQAEQIARLLALAKPTGDPVSVLILGPPGIGKSELAEHFVRCSGASKWSVAKFNGTQVKIEEVEELARKLHYRDLFGDYRVIRIEEVDKVPAVAQVRLLTLLDDLPPHNAIVCTSNCRLNELEVRFQRRFTVIELAPPSAEDIYQLLSTRWPALRPDTVRQIATFACGNVGQALRDADAALAATPLALAA
jgi:replication-associated recombination protein RarA